MTGEPVPTDPWWDLRGGGVLEPQQRDALAAELAAELSESHPLHGHTLTVLAKSEANDDILVALAAGGWAIVHLTWSHKAERPRWPSATYLTLEEFERGLQGRT